MKKINTLITALFLFSLGSMASEPHFMTHPALSPDAQSMVFSFEGDLWEADLKSGLATRLTAMQGYETGAKYSPDGRWIAFTARPYGNADVFIMPAGGGEIKPLTHNAAQDEMENWSWDSKTIYFRSTRFNSSSVYTLPMEGGNPKRLFDHYFNVIHNVAIHPQTQEIFFNDTWESLRMTSRKRYKGQYDPDIQSYHPETEEHKVYTSWDGKDMWATIDKNGRVYFVSDKHNGQYNLYQLGQGESTLLTRFKTSISRPEVSANGELVVFEKDYQLFLYHTQTQKTTKIKLTLNKHNILQKEKSYTISGKISNFAVSPDNKKLAFVSRGDLFVSDIKGKFIKKIVRPKPFERVHEVAWLKDNQTLLLNQTWDGYTNWFTLSADGTGAIRQVTKDKRNNRALVMNPDRTQAVYLSGRDELRLLDLESMESSLLVQDEFWGLQSGAPDFSADGKWLTYTAKRDFEDDVFVINLSDKKPMNLTRSGVSESSPAWSQDGKYIYLVTNRLRPSYPRGAGDVHLFKMALDFYDGDFRLEEFDKLFLTDTTKKKKDTILNIKVNPDRIWERMQQIGPRFGSQGGATVLKNGSSETLLFSSNHDKGTSALWKTVISPFEKTKTEKINGVSGRAALEVIGDKVYALSGGNIYTLNLAGNKATKINLSINFTRNLQEEFEQMFAQTWANIEENFYHEELHGEDWEQYRTYYEPFLPFLNNRADLRLLLNDMLGEMNSSHMGFNSSGTEESSQLRYVTLEPGLQFKEDEPFVVERVIPRSAADKSGIDIQAGDQLIAVDGLAIDEDLPRDYYFYKPARIPEMTLTLKRGDTEKIIRIQPGTSISRLFYEEWTDQNRHRVKALSNDKIAYAHMKNMGTGELNNFIMTLTRELKDKEGLILDLRYNTGGNVHDDVLRFLQQRTYLQWKSRGGVLSNQSNFAPADVPIVLLINEQSLSDAEMTAAGFKELGLGTIIGTETYRWIIFTSGMGLVDGSSHRMPAWGCYTLDGKNLEREGVAPDIYVKQSFVDRLKEKDPQIERAVQEILGGH